MSDMMTKKDYPQLFEECLTPAELSKYKSGSHKKMDWKCSTCGHMWTTEIRVRAQKKCGCPHCNNGDPISLDKPARRMPQKVRREDSLGYLYPEIAAMWDSDKNEYSAFDYKPRSGEEVYWVCQRCGHTFKSVISNVVATVHKCPKCSLGFNSSFGEQFIYFTCVEAYEEDQVFQRDTSLGFEIDVLVPSKNIGIEYGAWHWHRNRQEDDIAKIERAKNNDINILCVYDGFEDYKEDFNKSISHAYKIFMKASRENYDDLRDYLVLNLGISIDSIDWEFVADKAKSAMHERSIPYERSFEYQYPHSKDEWDYEKNYPIVPLDVAAGSQQKYHFICSKGHNYVATPEHKTKRHDGCPVCSHRKIVPGINSLADEVAGINEYWDWEKNKEDPRTLSPYVQRKEWHWKCPECGYKWDTKTVVLFRLPNEKEYICPACAQRIPLMDILDKIRLSIRGTSYVISSSLLENGNIKENKYREKITKFIQKTVFDNRYSVSGNNKFWIVETPNIYIRISKDGSSKGVIQQCYILDSPLGKKTVTGKKGEAEFSNVTPVDISFGTCHPELMPYWDWDKNEKDPYAIPDNIQAQKKWHWKCPDCSKQWTTTRPIKCGGNKSFICRDCHIRERIQNLLDAKKVSFYDCYELNGQRHITPNASLLNIIERIADGAGSVDMDYLHFYLSIDAIESGLSEDISIEIKKNNGRIVSVSGIDCPEAPRDDPRRAYKKNLSKQSE